ncbi:30S ribosomal protein S16 [Candidatus Parcubacteria bacterium]|nr:30S ribosomal protein S16 [Candidatus Parcubacteria bacterium]
MLTIRLTRKGKKNQPFFRIVVIDKKRSSKGGRAVEVLGYINPLTKKHSFEKERMLHWIKMGAQPTPRIHNLLVTEKVIDAKKVAVFNKTKKALKAEAVPTPAAVETPAAAPAPETPAPENPAPQA